MTSLIINYIQRNLQELLLFCKTEKVQIGLHTSYDAGKTPALISTEKELLERQTGKSVTYNRHHYLASREPEDMVWLEKAGITDDFTMGYRMLPVFASAHLVRYIGLILRINVSRHLFSTHWQSWNAA